MTTSPVCWAVTGATGLVGNNLVRALCAEGARVRVLARGAGRKELAGLPVETIEGDLSPGSLAELVRGADVVVHAAANVWVGTTGRADLERVNVGGTGLVCDAVLAEQAATGRRVRLIQVSSVDALGLGTREHPATEATPALESEGGVPYVDTKRAADRLVRGRADLDAVFVHPTYMLGPWDWRPSSGRMLLEIAKGKGLLAPSGGNNFVDVRDVVAGIRACADPNRAPSGSAWILGNENLTYLEAWTRMAGVVGARPPLGETPRWLGLLAAAALEVPLALGMKEGDINPATTRMSFLPHYFDPTKAQRELGVPATQLETALADAWAWFGAHGYR